MICEMAMIKLSAVLMMAASDAVRAITPTTSGNPPHEISCSMMAVKGDGGFSTPASNSIWTPMVPMKTPTSDVSQGPTVDCV